MKKKLLGICLLSFLIGCKGEESKVQEVKQESKIVTSNATQVIETKVSSNIFNEKALSELKKVQERLKVLYSYSTELKYEFSYDNTPIGISKENQYWFGTLNQKNQLFSMVSINLNDLKPYIYLENPYTMIEMEYEEYLKIIEKVIEIKSSLYNFEAIRDMEVVLFDNILVNSKETKITLLLPKKGNNLIQFISKEDEKHFSIKLEDTYDLEKSNNLEAVNNIVLNYTPKFLEDVINLSQRYKKLDYIVKNSKEISDPNKVYPKYSALDLDWVNSEENMATYYASGRVKNLNLIIGEEYVFEDKSNISKIRENINLLRKLLKEKNIEENSEMIFELESSIGITLNVDESNLNITTEEIKELKKLREEAKELFQESQQKKASIIGN